MLEKILVNVIVPACGVLLAISAGMVLGTAVAAVVILSTGGILPS
jgi:archaellin